MKSNPYLNKAIANILHRRRMELSMSKKKLSEKSSITRIHISDIEEGNKNPTVNAVFSLCEALQLNMNDFTRLVQEEMSQLKENDTNTQDI